MSAWVINEAIAAIDRKHRRGELREYERNRIIATIITHAIQFAGNETAIKFIPVADEIVSKSKDIIMNYHLSADDSLHLYTAFAKDCVFFVHRDDKLAKYTSGRIDDLQMIDLTNHAEVLSLTKQL
jgi:predicted nucleic acid-binding protein